MYTGPVGALGVLGLAGTANYVSKTSYHGDWGKPIEKHIQDLIKNINAWILPASVSLPFSPTNSLTLFATNIMQLLADISLDNINNNLSNSSLT